MKNWAFLGLLVAVGVIFYVLSGYRESFVPEFLDQRGVKQTAKTSTSSYEQQTNHMKALPYPQDPIPGVQTPFRVNMVNSYME
jgi:hypothetical protein